VKAGEEVLQAGVFLGPPEVALLASLGVQRPVVGKRPIVTVFSTGDELRPADTITLGPGQIRDSNRPMMLRLVVEAGGEAVDGGIVADTEDDLVEALEQAAAASDAILTSGGVSMGEYDLIKRVMAERGNVEFWQVAMQPAKPFAFGFVGKTPLFGLPGNPVSVMVAFEQFARPALLAMQGASRLLRPRIGLVAGERFETDPEKEVFLRVAFDRDGEQTVVRSSGGQSSNVLSALAAADGFAVVPVGVDVVERGEMVEVELFRSPPSRRPS
jgi:molybdopterin molybdotransferase